jgi:uncharacterized protein YggE
VRYALLPVLLFASAAGAQSATISENTLQVNGTGRVSAAPDVAVIEYSLAGEGATADQASRALVATRKAIVDQLGALLEGQATATDSNLVIMPVRGSKCENAAGYNAQPRLSQGECAVTGYLATSQGNMRTPQVAKAGTAVGLASRLGARDARIQGFELSDPRSARRAAVADAVTEAGRQAGVIAAAAGRRLGPIIAIRDQSSSYGDVIVTRRSIGAPPPPPPPPPVQIDLSPRPIETTAGVDVTYSLLP